MEKTDILQMHNITKQFGPVAVLDDVDFNVIQGEVHALVGANGAGKSTLMKILNGIYTPTSGEITLNGKTVVFDNPRDAFNGGVSMIHQELDLVGNLSVAENIFLGREKMKNGFVDRPAMFKEAQELLDSLHFDINATDGVERLSTAKQQMVLIARTILLNTNLIVMDEPTSALSYSETEALFDIIRMLKKKGISIIYISHYLREIFTVADRVTVLRNGKVVKTSAISECTEQQVVEWMVGYTVERHRITQKDFSERPEVLRVENLSQKYGFVDNISLVLRKGEVIGLAGAVGSGRTELLKMIYGAEERKSGKIFINGKERDINTPGKAVSNKIGFVPEDRKLEGLALIRSVGDNLALPELNIRSKAGIINFSSVRKLIDNIVNKFQIKCTSPTQLMTNLSGGNQQKVAIGKWLSGHFRIILFDQPTRGVDVGSKSEIYDMINELAAESVSLIIASDEIEELMDLCDRILVFKKGKIAYEFINEGNNLKKIEILEKMIG